jgi:hypothetical protein
MPRYFFDISDGVDLTDEEGQQFPDLAAARAHAISRTRDFVARLDGGGQGGYIVVTIRDEARAELARIRLVCQIATT